MIKNSLKPDNSINFKLIQTVFTLPPRRRNAFIAVCAAFSFTLFFLMPLDLYFNNIIEFNISPGYIVIPLLAVCAAVFLAAVLAFPLILRGIALDIATLLLCGTVAAFYVQVLFLNGDMSLLTGGGTEYSMSIAASINRLVFFIIIFIPLCFWKGLKDSKKFKNVKWETGIICVSVVILGMQTAGLVAAMSAYDSAIVRGPDYLSYSKAFQLSSEKNICVFITDSLDVKDMNELTARYPELHEQLDGFTYYKNNVSSNLGTFPSITQLLTGEIYNRRYTITGYKDKAWAKRNFIDILRENGYDTTLLIGELSTFGRFSNLYNRADNLTALDEHAVKVKLSQIVKTTLGISSGRAAPYFFKELFFRRFDSGFSNDFFEWPDKDILMPAINNSTDINFYTNLKTTGLYTQNEHKSFSLAHLNCAHDTGYRYNPDSDTVELFEGGDSIRGCFAILNEYFMQMKELGVYDNSTIILIADHGSVKNIQAAELQLTGEITSALLIKPENARGSLKTDAESELSHDNFRASVLQTAGLPHDDFGLSYFDIIDRRPRRKRELYTFYSFGLVDETGKYRITGDADDLSLTGKYVITGDANDFSNWTFELQIEE